MPRSMIPIRASLPLCDRQVDGAAGGGGGGAGGTAGEAGSTAAAAVMAGTRTVKGACPYCGVGCGIVMHVENERIVRISGDADHPANAGRLCTKGSSAHQAIRDSGRLERAYLRQQRSDDPAPASIDGAIAQAAARLRAIIDRDGPEAIAFYLSGQMSIEAQYLATKLAKGFVRTPYVEANSRLCMASAAAGYKQSLGADGPPGSYDDIDRADLFFVIGANMADCHPILFLRMMDRIKKAGSKLIVVDPRRTTTADKADLYLRIRPGTDLALLHGLLHVLHREGRVDHAFVARYTEGWESMPAFLAAYTPGHVANVTGLTVAEIEQAARWIGEAGEWSSFWTMGLNQSTRGTAHTTAVCNLHLATGKICRSGSGPFSLTGQPNAMGGREMGYMGPGLPGQRAMADARDRAFVERLWALPAGALQPAAVTGTVDMFRKMADGAIKACWIICTNPVATVPNRQTVIDGLTRAECVIVQDAFMDTETNRYADVLLPGALWAEGDGVTINSERNITLTSAAVPPPADALPDWEIIARVATAMGYGDAFAYRDAAAVFDEIALCSNPDTGYDLRGVSYRRLQDGPLQWPCPPEAERVTGQTEVQRTGSGLPQARRNPVRYVNDGVSQTLRRDDDGTVPALAFPTPSGKARFVAHSYRASAEHLDNDFSFVLNTGRLQHQWHTMTKTGKVATLNRLNPRPFVELHPDDAARLGIVDAQAVELQSRRGRAVLPAVLSDRVAPGECFAPMHWNDVFGEALCVNAITQDAVDPVSLQPEMKYSAVTLTAAAMPVSFAADAQYAQAAKASPPLAPDAEGTVVAEPAMDSLAAAFGLTPEFTRPPRLSEFEQRYLAGFLAGLRSRPGSGVGSGIGSGTAVDESAGNDKVAARVGTPALPDNAPFSPAARAWIDGMLAARFGLQGGVGSGTCIADAGDAAALPIPKPRPKVTLLWASQTGNIEALTEPFATRLMNAGCEIRTTCMSDFEPHAWVTAATDAAGGAVGGVPAHRYLLLMTSTFGDGDAPDNGQGFWDGLCALEGSALSGSSYSVLAFGDRAYDQFCGHGVRLDAKLAALGAQRLHERVDCEVDDTALAEQWLDRVVTTIKRDHAARFSSDAATDRQPELPGPDDPDDRHGGLAVTAGPSSAARLDSMTASKAAMQAVQWVASTSAAAGTRNRPVMASLCANELLNRPLGQRMQQVQEMQEMQEVQQVQQVRHDRPEHHGGVLLEKETRRIALSIAGTGLLYEAGDAIGIWPTNCPALVDELLALSGADGDAMVTVPGHGPVRFAEALLRHFEIARPSAGLLSLLSARTTDPALAQLLLPANKESLQRWLWGRQIADVLDAFPVQLDAATFAQALKRLQPRLYSIASSPLVYPDEIHLTVGTVRYQSTLRIRKGVSSTFLADRAHGLQVPVFIQTAVHFRPPRAAQTPMIMVGPGTGIAPFRAFLQDRRARGHTGRNWLIFGERHRESDFYYRDEWEVMQRDGFLTRLDCAFSRDQAQKCYVQDRLREQGAQVWAWLNDGAMFYVCGDASRMAKDVDAALTDVVAEHGGMSVAQAADYLRGLVRDKRYLRDVY